ncbi:MAG: sulfatase-like hydrolase/transferase, partial [Planctomycetota bacterium]
MYRTFWILLLFISGLISDNAMGSEPESQPNILWIITDDQRSDSLACYNLATTGTAESALGYVESPNVDKLAKEGVFFTNAFCNSMACAPSRSSMHTGKYVHRSGMYGFRKAHQAADCASLIIPQVLQKHGYQPSLFGKGGFYIFDWEKYHQWGRIGCYQPEIHRNDLEKTAASDFWFNRPWGQHNGRGMVLGTEEVYRFRDGATKRFWLTRKDQPVSAKDKSTRKQVEDELDILRSYSRRNKHLIIGGVSSNSTDNTLDGAIKNAFENHLDHAGKSYLAVTGDQIDGPDPTRPIFTHLSFCFPHTPVLSSHEFRKRFSEKNYKIPQFSEKEAERMTGSLRLLRDDMDFAGMKEEDKLQAIRDYYAFCTMGDHLIGQAVDSFKKYSLANKQEYAIVYVCGDHGWHQTLWPRWLQAVG